MAAIGSISLEVNGVIECGLALLLVKPAKKTHEMHHAGAIFRVSPDTPFIVCCFSGKQSHSDAYDYGRDLVQEGLDLMSITGREDLATRDGDDEYIVWWTNSGNKTLAYGTTATSSFSVGNAELIVHDANGNLVKPNIVIPQHHLALRFYRLAQVSDDLFDAYRNMYLAFEALLSSRYPKGKGKEIDWLEHSLNAAADELNLNAYVPSEVSSPVKHFLGVIYNGARLPLFHAKDGHAYFAPVSSPDNRSVVVEALQLLTHIVIRMADVWLDARRRGGWVNLDLFSEFNKTAFNDSEFVVLGSTDNSLEEDIKTEDILNEFRCNAIFGEIFDGKKRHHVHGCMSIPNENTKVPLQNLFLVSGTKKLIYFSPETSFDLDGFKEFQIILFLRGKNGSQPKYVYSR